MPSTCCPRAGRPAPRARRPRGGAGGPLSTMGGLRTHRVFLGAWPVGLLLGVALLLSPSGAPSARAYQPAVTAAAGAVCPAGSAPGSDPLTAAGAAPLCVP